MPLVIELCTHSPEETDALAEAIATLLAPGDFISLRGELGAGKTRFAQSVAAALGVASGTPVTSPTYTLMNIHVGRLTLYHFDLYRLSSEAEIVELGFTDYFDGNGVCLVEWPEKLSVELPAERLEICFSYIDDSVREIKLIPFGARFKDLLNRMIIPKKKD